MEYKIVEKKEDPKESVIEKTGHVIKFSIYEVEAVSAANEKELRAVKGKREVEAAKMSNIEHFHPFVLDLTPEQLMTVYMYQEAKVFVEVCDKKIAEFEKTAEELAVEMADMYTKLPELKVESKVQDLTSENTNDSETNNTTESESK